MASKSSLKINPTQWYAARDVAPFLEVTEQTVTGYCRKNKLKARKIGPKMQWHIRGSEIVRFRKKLGLDTLRA